MIKAISPEAVDISPEETEMWAAEVEQGHMRVQRRVLLARYLRALSARIQEIEKGQSYDNGPPLHAELNRVFNWLSGNRCPREADAVHRALVMISGPYLTNLVMHVAKELYKEIEVGDAIDLLATFNAAQEGKSGEA